MRPLADIRIVALEQYGAGPFGSLHLADLGAEIIKIEDPGTGGDVGRYVPPYQEGEDSLFFETFNRNKRSLSLDVTSTAGREVLEDLARVSDAMYSNLRGDVPARLRITYDDLKAINPRIVCCSLTGFGMTGPRAAEPGYDYILQGLAGWMSVTGEPDSPPAKTGLSLVDYMGGMVAALALVSGIHAARRDGAGMDCDLSLYDVAISMLTYPATWHLTGGYTPTRTERSAHPSIVPFQNFPTADGWIVVGCAKDKFYTRLAEILRLPDDPRFATMEARRLNKDELIALIDERLRERTAAEWLDVLTSAGVPCAPVNTVEQALAEPHTHARGLIVEADHPRFGTVRMPASPVRVGDPSPAPRRAPLRNEDADHVLRELLRYDDERIAVLTKEGAFGDCG